MCFHKITVVLPNFTDILVAESFEELDRLNSVEPVYRFEFFTAIAEAQYRLLYHGLGENWLMSK